jgi:hypothetical protein
LGVSQGWVVPEPEPELDPCEPPELPPGVACAGSIAVAAVEVEVT